MTSALYILYFIYLFSSLIGVVCFKRLSTPFKWVAILLWITLLNEAVSRILLELIGYNTPVNHVYVIFCVPVYYKIYEPFLSSRKAWRPIQVLFVMLFLFCLVNSSFIQPIHLFPAYNVNATSLVVVTCSLLVFLKMLDEPVATPLVRQSKFWLNTAVFFYHAAAFFVWTMTNYVYENNMGTPLLYKINIGMCWMLYSVLGISLWLNKNEYDA